MEKELYSVWHYNGQGIYSMWYRDQANLSKEQAESLKKELQAKEYQGWYAHVGIFPNDINPNE